MNSRSDQRVAGDGPGKRTGVEGTGPHKPKLIDAAAIGSGLTLAVLLVGGVLGSIAVGRLDDERRWVGHTHEVIGSLETLLSALKDVETARRGYLMAEDEKYLELYTDAAQRVQNEVAKLKDLASGNADQQARLAALVKKADVQLDELKQAGALVKAGDRAAALKMVRSDTGKAATDDVRRDITAVQQAEQNLLKKRAGDAEAGRRTTILSVLLPAIIGVVLVSVVFYLSRRNLRQRHRAALAVAEHKERLRTTLASIGDAVISTDADGNVTDMNAVAESLTGWTNVEASGVPLTRVFNIVSEHTRRPVENPALRALKEGTIVGLANHTVLIAKDGTQRPIDDSAAPVRCKSGEVVGCVLVFRDITERHKAEASLRDREERFRRTVNEIAIPTLLHADDGQILLVNKAWTDITGYRHEDIPTIGDWAQKAYGERQATAKDFIDTLFDADERSDNGEWVVTTATGEERVWHFFSTPVGREPGGRRLLVSNAIDVTDRKRAEEKLRASEERFTFVRRASGVGFWYCDLPFDTLQWDELVKAHFHLPPDAPVTIQTFYDRLHPDDREPTRRAIERSIAGRTPYDVNYRTVDPAAGTVTWVRAIGRTFYTCDGTPARFDGVTLDITDHKRAEESLEESEHRLRFVMDSVPQKIFTATPGGGVDYFNPIWSQFTGVPFEQIRDWGWTQFVHPDDVAENVRVWKRSLDTGEPFQFEHRFRRHDGAYRWHVSRAVPMRAAEGRVVMWIGSNTDIHEQMQTAEDLRRLTAELSEADRRKDEFLATLAHELRNPLAPLRNGLQIMRLSGGSGAAVEQARTMMERQLGQMVHLVDDLLDVSRISRGKLELRKERVELAAVLNNAVETSRPVIEAGGHELTVVVPPTPVFVDADATRLGQVFSNLLNNSAKYSERGGHIRLTVGRQGSDVVVSVTDTGVGIPPAMLHKIFEMFTQVDRSLEKSQGGLGIGLTLVKRLVELHDGTVEARSDGHGKGSEFVVRLPVVLSAVRAAGPPAAGDEPAGPADQCRILVADDNRDAADSLATLLGFMGNEVCTANDGLQAVNVANEFRPDVILLDIGMPKLDGYEACRRIREYPWGEKVVLIALTGWGQDEDRRRSREAGFTHHMVKPVDPAALEKLLAGVRAAKG